MNDASTPFRGMLEAVYGEAADPSHRGNICIEALPPFVDAEGMSGVFGNYPRFAPEERALPKAERMMRILRLRTLFEPLEQHEEICDRIGTMVRYGYADRNPVGDGANRRTVELYRRMMSGEVVAVNEGECSTAMSVAVYGGSGTGKTSVVRRALDFLPQVLWHGRHGVSQVVWLRLDCPSNGSPTQLMLDLLGKLDQLVGSCYARDNRRVGLPLLVRVASNAAARHNLGIIVLDEVQRVLLAKGAHTKALLDFFVSLANEVKVPLVFVGTRAARKLLESAPFDVARRVGEFGTYELTPLRLGPDWERLVTSLLDYQWVRRPIDPDDRSVDSARDVFSKVLHHESQGILALAVRLFQMAQVRAIDEGQETITPALLREVAGLRFAVLQPVLDVLRAGGDASRYDLFFEAGLLTVDAKVEHLASRVSGASRPIADARREAIDRISMVYRKDQATAAVEEAVRKYPGLDGPDLAAKALDVLKPVGAQRGRKPSKPMVDLLRTDGPTKAVGDLLAAVDAEADLAAADDDVEAAA